MLIVSPCERQILKKYVKYSKSKLLYSFKDIEKVKELDLALFIVYENRSKNIFSYITKN